MRDSSQNEGKFVFFTSFGIFDNLIHLIKQEDNGLGDLEIPG